MSWVVDSMLFFYSVFFVPIDSLLKIRRTTTSHLLTWHHLTSTHPTTPNGDADASSNDGYSGGNISSGRGSSPRYIFPPPPPYLFTDQYFWTAQWLEKVFFFEYSSLFYFLTMFIDIKTIVNDNTSVQGHKEGPNNGINRRLGPRQVYFIFLPSIN